ncbi:MAG: FHA domain-containing protein [Verrucomicrobiota bacterium]|nr:FHA domain-containing protein [Verrucomicrobiota bacterium]
MSFEIEITFEGETRTLEDSKPELTVGRSTPAAAVDVDLSPDKSVSRKHFLIKLEYNMGNAKNEAWIVDLGSNRGTLVNGEPVTDPVKVSREDVVQAGDSELRVKLKHPPKNKSKMSFQEKVAARSSKFGENTPDSTPQKSSKPKDRPTRIATSGEDEVPPPPPMDEPVMTSSDEIAPGLMAALTAGAYQTECAGFVAYSIEDLATAANRYAREHKMHTISASVVQEGKGSSACFRALVVFHNPNSD